MKTLIKIIILAVAAIAPAIFIASHSYALPEAPELLIPVPQQDSLNVEETMYDDPLYWGLNDKEMGDVVFLAVDRCCASDEAVDASWIDAEESGKGATYANFCLIKAAYDLGLADELMGNDERHVKERFDSLLNANVCFKIKFERLPNYDAVDSDPDHICTDHEYNIIVKMAEGSMIVDEFAEAFRAQYQTESKQWDEGHRCLECALKIIKIADTHSSDLWADTTGELCETDEFILDIFPNNKELRQMWYNLPNSEF